MSNYVHDRDGDLYGKLNTGLSKLSKVMARLGVCRRTVLSGAFRGKYLDKLHRSIRMRRDPAYAARELDAERELKRQDGARGGQKLILMIAKLRLSKHISGSRHGRGALSWFAARHIR